MIIVGPRKGHSGSQYWWYVPEVLGSQLCSQARHAEKCRKASVVTVKPGYYPRTDAHLTFETYTSMHHVKHQCRRESKSASATYTGDK